MRVFAIASLLLIVVTAIGLLMPLPGPDRIKNDLANLLHFPSFFFVTFLLLVLASRAFSQHRLLSIAIATTVILVGAFLEVLQSWFGRSSSLHDLVANTLGGAAAWLIHSNRHSSIAIRRATYFASACGLVFVSYIPVWSLVDVCRQHLNPERIGFFYDAMELHRWYFHAARVSIRKEPDAMERGNTLCLQLFPDQFPAAQLQSLTRDWTNYRTLRFQVTYPKSEESSAGMPPVQLQLLIRDFRLHPQPQGEPRYAYYRKLITLQPGDVQQIEIPVAEVRAGSEDLAVNLRIMRFIEFMALELTQPVKIELRAIELI